MMKKFLALLLGLMLTLSAIPAMADDTGAMTEQELSTWVLQMMNSVKDQAPLNDPEAPESLTEDGYASVYDSFTLYFSKPAANDVQWLNALSVTDENLSTPRGIKLGDTQERLMSFYGWLNPTLAGDDSFAPLYLMNQLPTSAYWAWAQREGQIISRVQCAIHIPSGDSYTDAGITYTLDQGVITAIKMYGLTAQATRESVESNVDIIAQLMGGSKELSALGNAKAAFSQDDLVFSGLDYRTLNEEAATKVFGAVGVETWTQDDTSEWMYTAERTNVMITYMADENKQNLRADALLITQDGFEGPRGIKIGESMDSVLSHFSVVENGGTLPSGATLLYGDGQTLPYATMENSGEATIVVNYFAEMTLSDGTQRPVNLYLTFFDGYLSEMMIYSW